MSNTHHQAAQEFAARAALARQAGRTSQAISLYSKAAKLEKVALNAIPEGAGRTSGILSVSLVSLLYKARRFDEAEGEVFRFLGGPNVLPEARAQLRELLEVIGDEKALLAQRLQYSGHQFCVSLRGGQVGSGTAPLELFLHKASGFHSLFQRVAEWIGHFEFRKSGPPPDELRGLLSARVTQPAIGSYRFLVKLTEPAQGMLFPTSAHSVPPDKVATGAFRIIELAVKGSTDGLEKFVPQSDYRQAVVKLVRNVVPVGDALGEVEVTRLAGQKAVESVVFDRRAREYVNHVVKANAPLPAEQRVEITGTLRAVHLDKKWIEVTTGEGTHVKCCTKGDMLDDVVGPMVNKKVMVSGSQRGKRFSVADIELASD